MGKRVVDDASLAAIADGIRSLASSYRPELEKILFPDGFEAGVHKVYNQGVKDGTEVGLEQGRAQGEQEGIEIGKQAGIVEGKQAEYDLLWDTLQNNGSTSGANYYYKFGYSTGATAGWTDENFNPKYHIICATGTTAGACLFYANVAITDTKVPIGVQGNNAGSMFYNASKLVTVRKLTVHAGVSFGLTFQNCSALENIEFGGTIGQDLDMHWSTKLTRASTVSTFEHLSTTTTGKTLTLSKAAVDKAFETSEGVNDGSTSPAWVALVNSRPNWTINLADV